MPLIYKYEQVDIPGWKGITCKVISSESNSTFISLGLEKGQTELYPAQYKWFKDHEEDIIRLTEAANDSLLQLSPLRGKDWDNYLPTHLNITQRKYKLLYQFCKDCKIVDS